MPSLLPRHLSIVLLVAAATQFAAVPAQSSTGAPCEGADSQAGEVSYSELGRASLCLVNRERRGRGLVALRANRRLALAARRHASDMVRYSYFAHNSRSGVRFTSRIVRTGYARGAANWRVGENLAWGAGGGSTPRSIVRGWMNSPPHRANILNRRFRDLGMGVAPGVPVQRRPGPDATYVHDFGVRR